MDPDNSPNLTVTSSRPANDLVSLLERLQSDAEELMRPHVGEFIDSDQFGCRLVRVEVLIDELPEVIESLQGTADVRSPSPDSDDSDDSDVGTAELAKDANSLLEPIVTKFVNDHQDASGLDRGRALRDALREVIKKSLSDVNRIRAFGYDP